MAVSMTESSNITTQTLPEKLGDKIRRYLAMKNPTALRRLLARSNFADIAEVMENYLTGDEALTVFQYLNIGQAAQVLTSLNEELQQACLASIPTMMGGRILRLMAADDAVDILQELDRSQSQKLLKEMPFDSDTKIIHHLMLEEPDTAAGIMSTDFIQAPIEGRVGDALHLIRRAEEKDFVYYCYLVDNEGVLVGVVSLKQLIILDEDVPLNRIATFDVKSLLIHYDQEFVANVFRKYYNLLAMPVVDEDGILRGIITLDDILDVIEEESMEDLYRASGIDLEEIDERNLLTGPAINAVKARMPWLSITLVGQLLASVIIASYRGTVETAVIAVSFMPLLTGLAGNMGTQSDTIAVRGLSQNLINEGNFREKLMREIKVAAITGVSFALVVGIVSYLIYRHWPLTVLVSSWIVLSLLTTASIGVSVPFLYSKIFKKDPAGVGGPFITTMSDILTFSIYLYIVTLFLEYMRI